MKKLLSLLLVLSLCLSSVILLASCTGKSAYEIAVENGFEGDEKAWLESLKGPAGTAGEDGKDGKDGQDGADGLGGTTGDSAYEQAKAAGFVGDVKAWLESLYGKDGKDGKTPVIGVNEYGYWVINGTPTLNKVDGSGVKIIDLELVTDTYTVVKGSATVPTVDIKYTLDSGETGTVALVDTPIDFTTEGEQTVTLTYSGFSKEVKVTVEGMMILFEDFSNFSDTATMAEILAGTGFKIPVPGPNNTDSAKLADGTATTYYNGGVGTWYLPAGQTDDLTPYLVYGAFHRANNFMLAVKGGRLYYQAFQKNVEQTFSGNMSDSCLILADKDRMAFAATGAYTIQVDFTFINGENKKPEGVDTTDVLASFSNGGTQNIFLTVKSIPSTASSKNGAPDIIGAVFGAESIAAAGNRLETKYKVDTAGLTKAGIEESENGLNILETLYGDSGASRWLGETVTVRIVVKETTATDYGYDVYIKKAGAPDTDFVHVGTCGAGNLNEKGIATYLAENSDVVSLHHRSTCAMNGYYIDNVAVWTGVGSLPTNTNTFAYEELNEAYLATLTPAA